MSGFLGHARLVAGLTAVSRVSGLARDALLSKIFGASPVWSAFVTAFMLPNLFRRLFGEGALAAAFVPVYARLARDDPKQAARLASLVASVLLLGLGGLVLALEAAAGLLLLTGVVEGAGRLTLGLAMVMLPFVVLVCTSAMLGGMLQTHGRFAPPAGAPILLNLGMIGGAAFARFGMGWALESIALALAISVVLAGALQLCWHLRALRGVHAWSRELAPALAEARGVAQRLLPVILGMGALQIGTLLDGLIAGYPVVVGDTLFGLDYPLDGSSAGVLFFAARLYQFPLGVFGIAIATAVFPSLARDARDEGSFGRTLERGVRTSLFIGIPATFGLWAVATPLVRVIYEGGAFDAGASARVVGALGWYALAVWSASLTHVLTRAFYAHDDTRTPVVVGVSCVALNVALGVGLMWTGLGERALALGTGLGACVQALTLALLAQRRWAGAALWGGCTRTLALALVMFGALLVVDQIAWAEGWWGQALRLVVLVGGGGAAYLVGARVTGAPELGWLLERRSG